MTVPTIKIRNNYAGKILLRVKPGFVAGLAFGGYAFGALLGYLIYAHGIKSEVIHQLRRLYESHDTIKPRAEQNPQTENLENRLTKGSAAPDFELRGLDGRTYRLSEYRGKPVVVHFWKPLASSPYELEMPGIKLFDDNYGDKVQVLIVTKDHDHNAGAIVRKNKWESLPVLLDTEEKVHNSYAVSEFSTNYIISGDGVIVSVQGLAYFPNPKGPVRRTIDRLLDNQGNLQDVNKLSR